MNLVKFGSHALLALIFCGFIKSQTCLAQGAFPSMAEPQSSVHDILTGPQNRPRADTYFLLGLSNARKGNAPEAFRQIAIGMRIEPNNIRLLNLRAVLWARAGRKSQAIAEFKRILRMAPNDLFARESLDDLERPLKPRFAPIVHSSASSPQKREAPKAPVDTAPPASPTRVLESEYFARVKQKQRCYFNLAAIKRAQESKGQKDPAKKESLDLKALVGDGLLPSAPVCPDGGEYLWKGGAPTCSKHGDLPTIEAEVNTVFNGFNKGMQAKIVRNYSEALKAFEQVCVAYPQWGEAHYQKGETLFRMGEDNPAIEEIRRALQFESTNLDAKLLLANLYFKVGHREAALQLLDEIATGQSGTVYGLSARSIAKSIRSGRNYYQIFPPN